MFSTRSRIIGFEIPTPMAPFTYTIAKRGMSFGENPSRTVARTSAQRKFERSLWSSRLLKLLNTTTASNQSIKPTAPLHVYEVRPRKDHRGVDLISDALPFGRLWYDTPDNAIGYAMHSSRSHDAVIRVYDDAGNVIEWRAPRRRATPRTDQRSQRLNAN